MYLYTVGRVLLEEDEKYDLKYMMLIFRLKKLVIYQLKDNNKLVVPLRDEFKIFEIDFNCIVKVIFNEREFIEFIDIWFL